MLERLLASAAIDGWEYVGSNLLTATYRRTADGAELNVEADQVGDIPDRLRDFDKRNPIPGKIEPQPGLDNRLLAIIQQVFRIRELTEIDLQNKTVAQLFYAAGEELGELARELNVEEQVFGNTHKAGGKDGSQGESVDLAIMGICIYFARGGDIESLGKRIQAKLDKWERQQAESLAMRKAGGCPAESLKLEQG